MVRALVTNDTANDKQREMHYAQFQDFGSNAMYPASFPVGSQETEQRVRPDTPPQSAHIRMETHRRMRSRIGLPLLAMPDEAPTFSWRERSVVPWITRRSSCEVRN